MQPLSYRTRILFLVCLYGLFVALLPGVLLYANGWRLSPSLGFYKTGGVYIAVPYSGVSVSINGEKVGTTGLLQRSFYIDNLAPSTFVLRASGQGYYPWERMVVVEPQLVTDTRVLLMPSDVTVTELAATSTATTTGARIIPAALYAEYIGLFSAPRVASSSLPVDSAENISLYIESGDLLARWNNPNAPVPSVFCPRPSLCVTEITIERSPDTVLDAAYFGGGVVYSTQEHGIYMTEVDARPTPRVVPLYEKPADFRIVNGALVVKNGNVFYEITL